MSGMPPVAAVESNLAIPADALVMLVGASGSGKSWWAHTFFSETRIVSSDRCRALVADDETDQSVNRAAFAVFYTIIRQRLSLRRLTIADSTSLSPFSRERLRNIAGNAEVPLHVLVVCTPLPVLMRNNHARVRRVPDPVLKRHAGQLREMLDSGVLETEGYAAVHHVPFHSLTAVAPLIVAPTDRATPISAP